MAKGRAGIFCIVAIHEDLDTAHKFVITSLEQPEESTVPTAVTQESQSGSGWGNLDL